MTDEIQAAVTYWADYDPRWPGVYYNQVAGECRYGGWEAGPNCLVIELPRP